MFYVLCGLIGFAACGLIYLLYSKVNNNGRVYATDDDRNCRRDKDIKETGRKLIWPAKC